MILSKLAAYTKSATALGKLHWQGFPFLPKSFFPGSPFNREAYNGFLVEAVRWNFGKNPIIYDVGANNGDFAMAFTCAYPGASLVLFEPIPAHVARLERLKEHGRLPWDIQPVALGATNETLHIEIPVGQEAASSLCGFNSAYLERNPQARQTTSSNCEVRRLDDIFLERGASKAIDLLKIDVEGFEFSVLEGASETLRNVNHMVVEVSRLRHSESRECPVSKMVSLAGQYGMSLFRMDPTIEDGGLAPLEYDLYFWKSKRGVN